MPAQKRNGPDAGNDRPAKNQITDATNSIATAATGQVGRMSTTLFDAATGLVVIDEAPGLIDLAAYINDASAQAEQHATTATEKAMLVGGYLIQAKSLVPHGEWDAWVSSNCTISLRVAQAYMRLSRTVPALDLANTKRVSLLPVRAAIRAIATDPTPPVHYQSVRVPAKDDADRTVTAFKKTAFALRDAAKWIGATRELKGRQVAALRTKLTDALAVLDAMTQMEVDHG